MKDRVSPEALDQGRFDPLPPHVEAEVREIFRSIARRIAEERALAEQTPISRAA